MQSKKERPEKIMFEESPVGESKSNGEIERAVQEAQGRIRSVKLNLESRYGRRIQRNENIVPWMIRHAVQMRNRVAIGQDGKTSWKILKGRDFKRDVAEFGECVWYLEAKSVGKDKFDTRWSEGIWLGIRDESGEILIGTDDGVVKARTFKRRPEQERWTNEKLERMKGVPWEPVPGQKNREIPVKVIFPEEKDLSLIHI